MGKIGDYNANIGIGNLYKVIDHGQKMGVVARKAQGRPDQGWKYDIPLDMKTPGTRATIYDKAIKKFEKENPNKEVRGIEDSQGWKNADETAKALSGDDKRGIKEFTEDLAEELHVNPTDKRKMAVLRMITEQLFTSKSVSRWGAFKKEKQEAAKKQQEFEALMKKPSDDNLAEEIADLDAKLGRDFSQSDLMAAAVTLSHMVARGELDVNHVETYLNETVFDYSDQKATLQMTARGMGEMRAKVIGEGWGDAYHALTRKYAELKAKGPVPPEIVYKYERLVNAANAIRKNRMEMVEGIGLKSIPVKPGDSTGSVLKRIQDNLEQGSLVAKRAMTLGHAYDVFDDKKTLAIDEVNAFDRAAGDLIRSLQEAKVLGEELEKEPGLGCYRQKDDGEITRTAESNNIFDDSFLKDLETYLRVLSQGAGLSARLERETEIRKSFKDALKLIPRDENGLCRAGTYTVTFSVSGGANWGLDAGVPELGAKNPKLSLGVEGAIGFAATVSIAEDGSASVSYGLNASGDVKAQLEAPSVTAGGGGGVGFGWTKTTKYKDIDSMCNDTSRMLLTLTTGKEWKNLFHTGGVNAKSRELAKLIDNYAMRSLMSEMKLMDDTDPYLTPMKYNPVTNITDTYSYDVHANAKLSAGADSKKAKDLIAKSGISGGGSISLGLMRFKDSSYKSHFEVARESGVSAADEEKYAKKIFSDDGKDDGKLKGEKMPREMQVEKLKKRLEELNEELDAFARVAAVAKRSNGLSRAGSEERYAAVKSGPYKGKTYDDFLNERKINLGAYWGIRNLFVRNIRRTLYAGDLAREAAYCEAKLRELMPGSDLPADVKSTIKEIEDGIYHNHVLHLDTAGRFSAERSALFQKEKTSSTSETVTASADMKLMIPGVENLQSVRVTSRYTNVEVNENDFYPSGTSGTGRRKLTLAEKNLDPLMKDLEVKMGKELLPQRPWEAKESETVTIDVSSIPYVGEVLDFAFRDKLNADLAGKALAADEVRKVVFKRVNGAIADYVKKSKSKILGKIVPKSGIFGAEDSHAVTVRLVKEYRPDGKPKFVYKLKEVSLDSKGKKSAGLDAPLPAGGKLGVQVSRSSNENVRYWVGQDSLSGVMSHYGRLGRNQVMWQQFLHEQKNSIAGLVKNAGSPQYLKGDNLNDKEFMPRSGLQGELDRVQKQMWMHGDRAQYDAFMDAWANVENAAGTIGSAGENAQKYGDAMTHLLLTISNFYKKDNAWWETKEMPLQSESAELKKGSPASVSNGQGVSLGVGMHRVEQDKCIRQASAVLKEIKPTDLGLKASANWKTDHASELTYLKDFLEEDPGQFYDDVLAEIGDKDPFGKGVQEAAIKAVMKKHVELLGAIEVGNPNESELLKEKDSEKDDDSKKEAPEPKPGFKEWNLAVRAKEALQKNTPVNIPKDKFSPLVPASDNVRILDVIRTDDSVPMVKVEWLDVSQKPRQRKVGFVELTTLVTNGVNGDTIKIGGLTKAKEKEKVEEENQKELNILAWMNDGKKLFGSDVSVEDLIKFYKTHSKSSQKPSVGNMPVVDGGLHVKQDLAPGVESKETLSSEEKQKKAELARQKEVQKEQEELAKLAKESKEDLENQRNKSQNELKNAKHSRFKSLIENIEKVEKLKAVQQTKEGKLIKVGSIGNVKQNHEKNLTVDVFIQKNKERLDDYLNKAQAQVMKQLGIIEDKSKFNELILAKFPVLDVNSDKFKSIVKDVLNGREHLSDEFLLSKVFANIAEKHLPADTI